MVINELSKKTNGEANLYESVIQQSLICLFEV